MIINERCNGQQTTFCLFSFPGGASGREPTSSVGDGGDEGQQALEEGKAAHSSVRAWRIPWTEEPGGLQSMGSQRVGRD